MRVQHVPALELLPAFLRLFCPAGGPPDPPLPDARLVVLRGAAHLAMLERHEAFTDAVEAFLADEVVPGPAPARTDA